MAAKKRIGRWSIFSSSQDTAFGDIRKLVHASRLDLDASAVELHLDRRRGDHSPRGRLPWRAAGAGSGNSTRQGGGRRGGGPYRGRRQGGGGGGG
eukprot:3768162-Pleurochrysis_carterae.AAC.1